MSKNVAVFVDVANIFYAAKAAGVDIDYVTLLKSATAGRDLVRAYAYTGLDPENENQRNFHSFLARHGYRVVSKDIRKYGDGKVKANLDIELVVDMMKTARNLDIAIVVSGDGDFAPAIRAVQEMGVRVEVISFRGNTSSDLMDVADQFTDITALARVEKGSSRSGRRVAGDDEDLSMTEVPDKQTEGTGDRRGRTGRGRGRGRAAEPETVAATGGRARSGMVALPGERLSRLDAAEADESEAVEPDTAPVGTEDGAEAEAGRRRRRRRGGRGRGRGRGRDEVAVPEGLPLEEDDFVEAPPARGPQPTPFGSIWDSQLGTSRPASPAGLEPLDEEDLEEPEIPEYLIAEQRRGRGGRGGRGQGRGARGAYAAAIERERYGRGGGGGINRYPDVSGRDRERGRSEQFPRRDRPAATPRGGGSEPWSEVPPELEAMLRAQLASKPRAETPAGARAASDEFPEEADEAAAEATAQGVEAEAAPARGGRGRGRRRAAGATDAASEEAAAPAAEIAPAEAPAPRRRTTRRGAAADTDTSEVPGGPAAEAEAAPDAGPRRRTRRSTASETPSAGEGGEGGEGAPAETAPPRRRSTRKVAAATGDETPAPADPGTEAPKRRTTRRKAAAEGESA